MLLVALAIARGPNTFAQAVSIGDQRQVDSQWQPGPPQNPDTYPRLVETSIAAVSRPSLPDALVATWVYHGSGFQTTRNGVAASTNGGLNWTEHLQAGWAGDPMTCADQTTGTLWVGMSNQSGIQIAKWNHPNPLCPNGCFDAPVDVVSGLDCDKAFMAAGPRRNQPNTTRLYVTYWQGGSANHFVKWSDELGADDSWHGPIRIDANLLAVHYAPLPRVGPNGEVYIFTWDEAFGVNLVRSLQEDPGNPGAPLFEAPIRIATRLDTWDKSSSNTNQRIPGQFNAAPFTYGAVDPVDGTLYCVYFDTSRVFCSCCPEVCTSWDIDLYFTKSPPPANPTSTPGDFWTTPQRILGNDTAPYDQFFAWLEVDTSHRLHLVFFDTRGVVHTDQTQPPGLRTRYAWSTNAGTTWTDATIAPYWTVSPPPPTPAVWMADWCWYGEYIGLAATPNRVYPIYPATLGPGLDPPGVPDLRIWTNVITWE